MRAVYTTFDPADFGTLLREQKKKKITQLVSFTELLKK